MPVITAPPEATHELGDTRFTALATPSRGSTDTALWIAELGPGAASEPHSLTREEIFVVLDGCATVSLDGRRETADRSDAIVVPAGVSLVLANTTDRPLRLLCCLPVGGRARLADGTTLVPPWSV